MRPESTPPADKTCDIFVDLDGTLLRSDLFIESMIGYVRSRPWRIFSLLMLLLQGRARTKAVLARRVRIDPGHLPYEATLIRHLEARRAQGSRIILATAAHWKYASQIARHLGFFDAVLATRGGINLKGARKLAQIDLMRENRPFVYAGDCAADRPIWRAAHRGIFVNAPGRDVRSAEMSARIELSLRTRPPVLTAFVRQMRLHQWTKNILLFVPLLTSHRYGNLVADLDSLLAFLAFGLCASGHYFINDLVDLDADRAHSSKRKRPLASGDLTLALGLCGAFALPVLGFAVSVIALPPRFVLALAGYFAITNLYTFYLKRVSTADVMALAVLYTIRVIAGAAAISVVVSTWLLAFSMFVFISLAYLKRYVEVAALAEGGAQAKGRGYTSADADTMFSLGIANSTAAIVVLALYISSPEVKLLYRAPEYLWLLCPLILYWINRIWVGARRGKIHDDPVIFAIRDRVSRLVGVAALMIVIAARLMRGP